ncbi:retron St85 family RNA-directed DNA polymerase [Hydrogenophaga sp.]|uniref:retron St85 family RNA-directed DNA polymerase n=1 Tax=Hydrogenophaga sp. TaxID=1904254 RepID=UPI002FC7F2E5
MTKIVELIATTLQLPIDGVVKSIEQAPYRTKKFTIEKSSGGRRVILQPSAQIKPILYWLQATIFDHLPIHPIATAFRSGVSILDNASAHKRSLYSVRVDIVNFFPSIKPLDACTAVLRSKNHLPAWAESVEAVEIISKACFDRNEQLPIGYTTSPSIANAVMFPIDAKLQEAISQDEVYGNAILTRYADDFVFSTDRIGACKKFVSLIASVLADHNVPKLSINPSKTRYMSRLGGSTLITGLRVSNEGNVVVHPLYRDHVRLLLKHYHALKLREEDVPKLIGHLAHIQHVDPAFFTKLSSKYFLDIQRLRSGTNLSIS